MTIAVATSTYMEYGDSAYSDYSEGGVVSITCRFCGFNGIVDVDHDGHFLEGQCPECDEEFKVKS